MALFNYTITTLFDMNLHSNVHEEFIKELNTQKRDKIIEVIESNIPIAKKGSLIKSILTKLDQLIKNSDQSLFIQSKKTSST